MPDCRAAAPVQRGWTLALLRLVVPLVISGGCERRVAGGSIDGKAVFAAACATCHGAEGIPPPGMAAQLGVRNLRAPEFRSRVTPELVVHQVRNGSKNKLMPAFAGALSEEQIRAVAVYVAKTLGAAPPGTGARI
jgi:mono/diheme cytochrome c family protein